jgi:gliding motility-associated-like protein
MYNRALTSAEIEELYIPVDKITSPDTVLFTGTSMQVRLPVTCAPAIQWSPSTGVSNSFIAEPVLTPPATTTYEVNFNYGHCQAVDSIHVTVADSADLDCDNVFFPTGFTPNGDNINDEWGMSNVVFLGEFISLEIFDRWGGDIFRTTDIGTSWDGTKNGEEIMPGMYVYLVTYRCDGEERKKTGSVVVIR